MKCTNFIILFFIVVSCATDKKETYAQKIQALSKHTKLIELVNENEKGRIVIAPEVQGKIITSTYGGLNGLSNGWLNSLAFTGDTLLKDKIGGEERLWFGPLGGQYSFYYQQVKPLSEDNWKVPECLSKASYQVDTLTNNEVVLSSKFELTNFTGTEFDFQVKRTIKLLEKEQIKKNLKIDVNHQLNYVAYESSNEIQNKGDKKWTKDTGLVSLWNAGMFEGSDETVVIIPLKKNAVLEDVYKYMGPLDTKKLLFKDKVLLFKVDGKYRSKIGVPNAIAPEIYGCYAKDRKRLTIIQYQKTNRALYFNSDVSIQDNPYNGEVIPIYNNGPMDYSDTNEVSFFELESTSPMIELLPNEHLTHYHRVYHFSGDEKLLNEIAENLLHINLKRCTL